MMHFDGGKIGFSVCGYCDDKAKLTQEPKNVNCDACLKFMTRLNVPPWYFRKIEDISYSVRFKPTVIEFLRIESGETFIHLHGTVYYRNEQWDMDSLKNNGITHYRILNSDDPRFKGLV